MTSVLWPPDRIAAPAGMRWPGNRNVAVVVNVAYEVWGGGKTSGVGPMGNPLPPGTFDHNADSYGSYGARAGIRRLAGILDDAGVQASIFTSGALAERDPDQVRALAAAGHEIVAHGYTQDLIPALLSEEEDLDSIRRSTDLIESVTGQRPTGWISPRATSGPETLRRLAAHGYQWHSDALDTDVPYLQRFPEGDLVAIPLSVEFNDLPHAMRFGRTPQQFVDMFDQALPRLLAAKSDVVVVDVLAHTHCFGRAASAWAYREVVERCASSDDIWLTTRGQIAEHVVGAIGELELS